MPLHVHSLVCSVGILKSEFPLLHFIWNRPISKRGLAQPSPPFLWHSPPAAACPFKHAGTCVNFSPGLNLVLLQGRTWITVFGHTRDPFNGINPILLYFSTQGQPWACTKLRCKGLPPTSSHQKGHHSSLSFWEVNLLPLPSLKCTPQVSHTHPPPLPPWWLRLCNKDFQTLTLGICVTLGK